MNYKLSHYTIITDPIDENDNCVVFATRTNNVLTIPKSIIDCINESRIDELSDQVLATLKDIKILVSENEDELLSIVEENKRSIAEIKDGTLYEVIQPSAMCQLGCYYCGQTHTKKNIAPELFDMIIDRIRRKIEAGNFKELYIGWFGGEPLMAVGEMRELTVRLLALAQEFKLGYSSKIVTNGLSLKENLFLELVRDFKVNNIEVTLDGTEEAHDSHRYLKQGGKSFSMIFNNLVKIVNRADFKSLGCNLRIRCNVDNKNHEAVSPLIQLLAEHGFQDKVVFYTTGIYSWGNDAHKGSLTKEAFAKKEIQWMIELIRLGFPVTEIPDRVKKVCMAVTDQSEMYDANGNVFNCTEVSYVSQYEKSDYLLSELKSDHAAINKRKFSDWNDGLLVDKFPCHSCKMLPVCGGACPKSWHEDMRACPSAKFNMKDRLRISHTILKSTSLEDRNQRLEMLANELWEADNELS